VPASGPSLGGAGKFSIGSGGTTAGSSSFNAGASSVDLNVPTGSGGTTGAAGSETISPDMACATGTAKASLTPVDLYIQFDRSGSMDEPPDAPKWPQAVRALTAFFQDSATAGLGVALRFFPDNRPVAGCGTTSPGVGACSAAACGQPLVPLGLLAAASAPIDAQEALLVQALSSPVSAPGTIVSTSGPLLSGSPLYPALQGALEWATAHQSAVPDHKTVVVFVTDGQSTVCESSSDPATEVANMAKLASAALKAVGVRTYTIGIQGSEQATMDQIAMAGGTTAGFFIGSAASTQTELIAALNEIRGSVISCAFPLPTAAAGAPAVDPNKINVNFTPTGGATQLIGKAAGANACQSGGWYYDDPSTPANITLCPSTCTRVQADSQAKLEVLLGCASQMVVPK
jgi:hypothetical protein